MDRQTLIKNAEEIISVSSESLKEFKDKRELVLYKENQIMLERPDIYEMIGGEKNVQMMKDNHFNHLQFISSIIETPDPETLVDTVVWVFKTYMSRGFQSTYWQAQLETWVSVFKENFSEKTFNEIKPLYEWLLRNISVFESLSREKPTEQL